jgi:hypothetical protein
LSIRFSSFLLYSVYPVVTVEICKRLRVFEEIEISRQSCKGDCEKKGGKPLRLLCLDFVQEFGLWRRTTVQTVHLYTIYRCMGTST